MGQIARVAQRRAGVEEDGQLSECCSCRHVREADPERFNGRKGRTGRRGPRRAEKEEVLRSGVPMPFRNLIQ